jgi:hypothetical protein
MALKNPPLNDITLKEDNKFSNSWIAWLRSIVIESRNGYTGVFLVDGKTITVEDGKIISVV